MILVLNWTDELKQRVPVEDFLMVGKTLGHYQITNELGEREWGRNLSEPSVLNALPGAVCFFKSKRGKLQESGATKTIHSAVGIYAPRAKRASKSFIIRSVSPDL